MKFSFIRVIVAVFTIATATTTWAQSFLLGDQKAVQDSLNGIWLCSVPHDVFGTDWVATITLDPSWEQITINGTVVLDAEDITFANVEGGKLYPFTALAGDSVINGSITFTWLPVLELNGEFGDEYTQGLVSLSAPEKDDSKNNMLAKLKWRGGVTNGANKHKRNYHIKFIDEMGAKKNRRMLGMRKDNHWKLDAGQIDPLRIRNRVCSDLWLDITRDPWHMSMDSSVVNGSHGKVTEVILNGKYHGIYGLIEPVDRKQLALIKYDSINNEFHGEQWVAKQWARTYVFPAYNNNSDTWNGMEVSYPDFEEVCPTDWSTVYESFNKVVDADNYDDANGTQTVTDTLEHYFDMPVMEDYFILVITLQALDNETKNIYYSCYDKALGAPRLTMTAWDLDISVGAKSFTYLTDAFVKPERPINEWFSNGPMYAMFNDSKRHRKEIIERYWQLRETYLNTDSLIARFQRAVDELEGCGAAAREEARWSGDSDIYGKVLDISGEMAYVADWLQRRMAYLDENVFVREVIRGDVDDDGQVAISDVTTLINHLLTGAPVNESNADVDLDSEVTIADVTTLIRYLLTSYWPE